MDPMPNPLESANRREVEFFDQFVTEHGDYDVLSDAAYARLLQVFEQRVRPCPGERCIDLGCGTGAFIRRLGHLGLIRSGMDISPRAVEHAKAATPDVDFLVGDIAASGLPDGSQDILCYSGVLHHVSAPQDRIRVLAEGHRLLSPGGRLFAFDPSVQSPSMWLYRDPRSPLFSEKGKTENEVLLHRSHLSEELAQAGFDSVQIRGLGGISFRFVESRIAAVILPLYNLYEELLRRSPLEDRLGTFLITVATKAT
jgi:SAM-dependent methyltransferase